MDLLFKGLILGFSVAVPVGPIGLLCIRKTLQFGRFSGLFSGLGAAFADTVYGVIAAFGYTWAANFLLKEQFWLRLFGSLFLLVLGLRIFFSQTVEIGKTKVSHKTLFRDFLSTFILTLTNPMTIFVFLALFAGLGLSDTTKADYLWLIVGVFIGSSLWWLILSEGITLFRSKVSQKVMTATSRIAGLIIAGFGAITLFTIHKYLTSSSL